MVVARHIRPALFAIAAILSFLAEVEATSASSFSFSNCVDSCIYGAGCSTTDGKCMCKAAKSHFLDNVAVCMYYHCPNEVRSFESSFIAPMVAGCKEINKPIPQDNIDEAEDTASTFADKLPPLTTSKKSTTSAKATPKTTVTTASGSKQPPPATTTQTQATETGSSTATTTTTDSTPSTIATATDSPTQAASQSSTSTEAASNSDPTDSNPFGTPPNAAGRSMTSWVWASLPLALAVLMR